MSLPRPTGPVFAFNRYRLSPHPPRLTADGVPVEIGARALELLCALVEAEGRPVSLARLGERGWPSDSARAGVDNNTVQAQVSALRRALGADRDLVVTVPGFGYRLAAPVRTIETDAAQDDAVAHGAQQPLRAGEETALAEPAHALRVPTRLTPFVGRHAELSELLGLVPATRIVTLAGAPGIGKTRLAREVARRLGAHFPDGVLSVTLPRDAQGEGLAETVALAIGIAPEPGIAAFERLVAALATRRLLLIVDCSEQLSEPAGWLVDTLVAATSVHVIATSLAPLFLAGEQVVPLGPLRTPERLDVGPVDAPEFDALRLLFARIATLPGTPFAAHPADTRRSRSAMSALALFDAGRLAADTLAAAALIARRLDGVPLALELAAAAIARRARTRFTLDAALIAFARALDDLMVHRAGALYVPVSRAAPLAAVLDLAVAELEDAPRQCLMRLAVFPGEFSRCSAVRLLAECAAPNRVVLGNPIGTPLGNTIDNPIATRADFDVDTHVANLIEAGFVEQIDDETGPTLRLPAPVRAFALDALWQGGEFSRAAAAHAQSLVPRLAARRDRVADTRHAVLDRNDVADLRSAFDWAIHADRFDLVLALVEGSEPLWRALGLTHEYVRTIRAAVARAEDASPRRVRDEMRLYAALARTLPLVQAPLDEVAAAWQQAYDLANACADNTGRQHALIGLIVCSAKAGEIERAADLQARYDEISQGKER